MSEPLPLSLLNDFLYCPRRAALKVVEGWREANLRHRLLREIKEDEDSLRFYFLDAEAVQRTEHHGIAKPLDLTEPLVL